ncbi:hypothetical protein M0811_00814 [Anaeramoeba ignava]|uniref:Uncharacterized protein n=1 Tax=Anaeramoeba ignava TaxID=1746090 RepID=A0A9Q0LKK0_ANAIG|nr:hypothetical protein M0811_00814 [Anaeramoeba ignava]
MKKARKTKTTTKTKRKKIQPIPSLKNICFLQAVKSLETTQNFQTNIEKYKQIPKELLQEIVNHTSFPVFCEFYLRKEFNEIFQKKGSEIFNRKLMEIEQGYRYLFAKKRKDPKLNDPFLLSFDPYKFLERLEYKKWDEYEENVPKLLIPKDFERKISGLSITPKFENFKKNFDIFTENQLDSLDWNNIIVAGGSVLACLQDLPSEVTSTKLNHRKYYLENPCYAKSDIDIFIYGLNKIQAKKKVEQIIALVKNENPHQVYVVRSLRCLTLFSLYPYRNIQIIFRLYKSPAEVLLGFDVDSCAVGYNGKEILMNYRCCRALTKQYNLIDLSRRSPSYEYRLYKYHFRGFAVVIPDYDPKRVDQSIFLKFPNHKQALGLAKLLLLDKFGWEDNPAIYEKAKTRTNQKKNNKNKNKNKKENQMEIEKTKHDDKQYEVLNDPYDKSKRLYMFDKDTWEFREIRILEKSYFHKHFKEMLPEPDFAELANKFAKYETGIPYSDYSAVHVPFGPEIEPEKVIFCLRKKRLLVNSYWRYCRSTTCFPKVTCGIGTDLASTTADMRNFVQSHGWLFWCYEWQDEEDILAFQKLADKFYVNMSRNFAIEWIVTNPGQQLIGSFHPLNADDWFEKAYNEKREEKPKKK